MSIDQRRAERHDIEREIEITRGETTSAGLTVNLSLSGAMVRVPFDPPLRVGDKIQACFTLPGLADPVNVQAQVRWVSEVDAAQAGIQFITGFRAKETYALGELLKSL